MLTSWHADLVHQFCGLQYAQKYCALAGIFSYYEASMTEKANVETPEVSEAEVANAVEQEFWPNPESSEPQEAWGEQPKDPSEDPKEKSEEWGQAEQTAKESGDDGTPKGVKKLLSQRNELKGKLQEKDNELSDAKSKIATLEDTINKLQQQEITDPEESKKRDEKVQDAKTRKAVHEENLAIVAQKAVASLSESTSNPEESSQKIKETMDKYPWLDPFDAFNMLVWSGEISKTETDPQEINKQKSNDVLGKSGPSMWWSSFDSMSTDEMWKQLQKQIDSGDLTL